MNQLDEVLSLLNKVDNCRNQLCRRFVTIRFIDIFNDYVDIVDAIIDIYSNDTGKSVKVIIRDKEGNIIMTDRFTDTKLLYKKYQIKYDNITYMYENRLRIAKGRHGTDFNEKEFFFTMHSTVYLNTTQREKAMQLFTNHRLLNIHCNKNSICKIAPQ